MQPQALNLNTKQSEPLGIHGRTPVNAPANRPAVAAGKRPDLQPVKDWEHFAAWCRQNGRQALPASDETLTLYFQSQRRAKRVEPTTSLGWLAITSAVLGVLAPGIGLLTATLIGADLQLSFLISGLFFAALQIVALATGWSSRQSPLGRAGASIALLSALAVAGGLYLHHSLTSQQAGTDRPALFPTLMEFKRPG